MKTPSGDLRPKSWSELQECLFSHTWDDRINRYRSNFIYRGLDQSNFELLTSLQRIGGPYPKLERHLLRNFQKYAHRDAAPGNSIWNWMATAQHHGLPTRLLDWTYSPYVALHFTTNDLTKINEDGVIWCLHYTELNSFLPEKLQQVIRREESNAFTAEMLESVCDRLEMLDELVEKEDFILFLEPPSLDERIVNQFALFSLMSSPTVRLDDWLQKHPELFFRIIIPAELKWEVRDKLDQANITERVLFPGLGGLSEWLKRHYSSKK
jgi:hypothetical protein